MILTEEQRAAIKLAMKYIARWPFAYKELHARGVLQAMIDSSEHIREPPKMVGFDLVARIRELEAENVQLLAALDESERVVAHKTKSAAHWYDEHLQARADRVQTRRVVEQQAARIKELEANCIYDPETGKVFVPDGHPELEKLRARNRDLEDAHKRSGAKYAKIINELRSSVYANTPGLKKQWDEILNAPANGKIGPDADAKPHCWQITEERKAALGVILARIEYDQSLPGRFNYTVSRAKDTLRAMLEEAQP